MKKIIFRLTAIMLVVAFAGISMGSGGAMAIGAGQIFEDVPESHWAFDYISRAYEKGFITETDSNIFEPDKSVTRAEFVQMIVTYLEMPVPDDPEQLYADVGEESPYFNAVAAAESAGILAGIKEDGLLKPDQPITREEAASVLGLAPSYLGIMMTMEYIDLTGIYEDYNQVNQRYNGAIQTVYRLGIMQGTSEITFAPKDPVTRAQAAVMLIRLLDVVERIIG